MRPIGLLGALAAAAVLMRLAVFACAESERRWTPDSSSYEGPARALLAHGVFAVAPSRLEEPELRRTPGYPLFIAAVYAVAGEVPDRVVIAQILLSGAAVLLIWQLAVALGWQAAAVPACVLYVLDLASLLASQLLLTDCLFALWIAAAAWMGAVLLRGGARKHTAALGLGTALALAMLFRPIAQFLFLAAGLGISIAAWRLRWPWRRTAVTVVLATAPSLLLLAVWSERNARAGGVRAYSLISADDLLWYRAAGTLAVRDGVSLKQAQAAIGAGMPDLETLPAAERHRLMLSVGLRVLRDNPAAALRMTMIGLGKLLLVPGETDLLAYLGFEPVTGGAAGDLLRLSPVEYARRWFGEHPWRWLLFAAGALHLAVLYGGCAAAAALLRREMEQTVFARLWPLVLALCLCALSAGPEAYARFRVPLTPILAVYAARGWLAVASSRRRGAVKDGTWYPPRR